MSLQAMSLYSPPGSMEKSRRILTFVSFFTSTACLILLAASLATPKWILVKPVRSLNRPLSDIGESLTTNKFSSSSLGTSSASVASSSSPKSSVLSALSPTSVTTVNSLPSLASSSSSNSGDAAGEDGRKFRGTIYFGLFQGTKILNYGFGDRSSPLFIKEELLRNPNLMPFGLWLFTVLCVAIAIIFGVVSCIFAIINTVMTPVETISGLPGLYLWNGMGALFCTGACISWLVQFRSKLRKNVMSVDEIEHGWTSENRAKLGFSFFLVVAALSLFILNIILVLMASNKICRRRNSRPMMDKNSEGVIMLY